MTGWSSGASLASSASSGFQGRGRAANYTGSCFEVEAAQPGYQSLANNCLDSPGLSLSALISLFPRDATSPNLGLISLPGSLQDSVKFCSRFANYDGAKIERMAFSKNNTRVEATVVTAQHRISIVSEGSHDDAVLVYGPTSGGDFRPYIKVRQDFPSRLVSRCERGFYHLTKLTILYLQLHSQEMLGASVEVRLERVSDGSTVFSGKSRKGGLEIESIEEEGISLLQK